jgi:hypothetical protein
MPFFSDEKRKKKLLKKLFINREQKRKIKNFLDDLIKTFSSFPLIRFERKRKREGGENKEKGKENFTSSLSVEFKLYFSLFACTSIHFSSYILISFTLFLFFLR